MSQLSIKIPRAKLISPVQAMFIPVCPDSAICHNCIGGSPGDLISVLVEARLVGVVDMVCGVASQDFNVAFVVVVIVGEDASAGSSVTADSGPHADRSVEDVMDFALDFGCGDEVFVAICAQGQMG
jgi:hypothetical protein